MYKEFQGYAKKNNKGFLLCSYYLFLQILKTKKSCKNNKSRACLDRDSSDFPDRDLLELIPLAIIDHDHIPIISLFNPKIIILFQNMAEFAVIWDLSKIQKFLSYVFSK